MWYPEPTPAGCRALLAKAQAQQRRKRLAPNKAPAAAGKPAAGAKPAAPKAAKK